MGSPNTDRFRIAAKRRSLKEKAILHLGGRCVICGYTGTPAAFDFHHLHGKDFNVGSRIDSAWDKVVNELSKCVLLCCRCHREVHDGYHPEWMPSQEGIADAWDGSFELHTGDSQTS